MKLATYIARRLLLLIPVLIGVTLITFVISHIIPVDPVHAWAGEKSGKDADRIRQKMGLDKPLWDQYIIYMGSLLRGDFGEAPSEGFRPVSDSLALYFPATVELTIYSMLLAIALGIPTGVISATKRDKPIDHVTRIYALVGVSIPIFWLGIMLLWIFYGILHIGFFSPSGRLDTTLEPPTHITGLYTVDSLVTGNWPVFVNAVLHLVLPAFCLSYISMAIITRMMRSSMLEVLGQEYIKAARSKGLAERVVIKKHAQRNALIPTTTVIGLSFGGLLGGAVLTETVFSWPGIGRWSIDRLVALDFTGVMAITVITAIIYVFTNLVVDIVYAYLDPRIRLE